MVRVCEKSIAVIPEGFISIFKTVEVFMTGYDCYAFLAELFFFN